MRKYLKTAIFFIFTMVLLNVRLGQAEEHYSDSPYFSYERFFPAMLLLESIPEKGGPQGELNKFAKDFSDGLYALSAENYARALRKLLRARRIWPEYFGTDFLIALVYEGRGETRTAARYYKGYLHKLKTFEAGEYPISGGVIRSIITSEIDRYNIASYFVADRLASQDIDIADVTIPFSVPLSLTLFVIFAFLSLAAYAAVRYFVGPYIKKQKRIRTMMPGYWICKNCGMPNLALITECEECGKKKD